MCALLLPHSHTTSLQIPAQVYDTALRSLLVSDPDAVYQLLKRNCIEQG